MNEIKRSTYPYPADILLPDFKKVDGGAYSVIACDQFTSEPEYWKEAEERVGNSPSALRLVLPEIYLNSDRDARVAAINAEMDRYVSETLLSHPGSMILCLRTLPGCAKRVVDLCEKAGVKMTEAGATHPYGIDPNDDTIRIAPSFPPVEELRTATRLLCLCLRIASAEHLLESL